MLSQGRRAQLDGIIMSLAEQGATQAEVQAVVADFTSKYGQSDQQVTANPQTIAQKVGGFLSNEATGNSQPTGFLGSLVQNTVGSKGLLGTAELPGLVAGQPVLLDTQTKLSTSLQGLAQQTAALQQRLRTETDPARKAHLQEIVDGNMQLLHQGNQASGQLEGFVRTPEQALGTAGNAALTVGGGALGRGVQAGVAGVLPEATTAVGRVAASLAPKILAGSATSGAFGASAAMANNESAQDVARSAGVGAITGAAIPVGVEIAKPILRVTGRFIASLFGGTTGAGGQAVQTAFRAGKNEVAQEGSSAAFTQGLKGEVTGEQVLQDAKQGLNAIKLQRATQYQKQLADISQQGITVDLQPVQQKLPEILNNFGVKETADGLDFSGSSMFDKSGVSVVRDVLDEVRNWSDNSAIGTDRLKQRISDAISMVRPDSKSGALLSQVSNEIGTQLDNQVPGYSQMTQAYAQASQQITDIQQVLSQKNGVNRETAIKKLLSILRENNDFRLQLVQQLEAAGGKDIIDKVAGIALSQGMPRGLAAKEVAGAIGGAIGLGSFATSNPKLLHALSVLLAFSPKVVGNAAYFSGQAVGRIGNAAAPVFEKAVPAIVGTTAQQITKPSFSQFPK